VDELSPAQSTEDLLPSFGPGDDHYNELTRLERIGRKVEDALPAFFALTLWIIGNVVGFVVYFGEYACWFETDANGGAGCVAAPLAVCFAKGAGMCLNINCALIVLPMCRRFLTWLRSIRPVRRAVPLDLAYDAHIVLGWTIAAFTFVHVTCHYINYASTPTPEDAIATDAGATGHGLLLILLLMCVTALPRFRRGAKFHVFILTHHLFVIFFFLLFVHGTGFVGPNFWKIGTWPLLLYFWERATRLSNTDYRHALRVVRCERLRGRVTLLQFEKPAGFRYLPGQYCFVAVPALAAGSPVHALEFHPFTISSAPHEPYVSLHIRSAGDWTSALHKLASAGDAKSKVDLCLMDGPYGSASEQVYDYDVSVMVGAGIGVTPFASILKDMRHKLDCLNSAGVNLEQLRHVFEVIMGGGAHRAKGAGSIQSRSTLALQKLYFFWTTREQGAFEWFGDLLSGLNSSSVSSQPTKGGGGRRSWELEICTYVTGLRSFEKGPTDLGSLFLKMALDLVLEATGKDLLTGSMSNQGTRFERPRWDDIFGGLARDHAGCSIGVFFCGPARLGAVLNEKCREFNERPEAAARQTRFTFHTEVF
jgi:NADPH oxidase